MNTVKSDIMYMLNLYRSQFYERILFITIFIDLINLHHKLIIFSITINNK